MLRENLRVIDGLYCVLLTCDVPSSEYDQTQLCPAIEDYT